MKDLTRSAMVAALWLGGVVVAAQDWRGLLGGSAARGANKTADKATEEATQASAAATSGGHSSAQAPFRAYQNYDFVPGDKLVFEDDFRADAAGEFLAHSKLLAGQGVINIMPDGGIGTQERGFPLVVRFGAHTRASLLP